MVLGDNSLVVWLGWPRPSRRKGPLRGQGSSDRRFDLIIQFFYLVALQGVFGTHSEELVFLIVDLLEDPGPLSVSLVSELPLQIGNLNHILLRLFGEVRNVVIEYHSLHSIHLL